MTNWYQSSKSSAMADGTRIKYFEDSIRKVEALLQQLQQIKEQHQQLEKVQKSTDERVQEFQKFQFEDASIKYRSEESDSTTEFTEDFVAQEAESSNFPAPSVMREARICEGMEVSDPQIIDDSKKDQEIGKEPEELPIQSEKLKVHSSPKKVAVIDIRSQKWCQKASLSIDHSEAGLAFEVFEEMPHQTVMLFIGLASGNRSRGVCDPMVFDPGGLYAQEFKLAKGKIPVYYLEENEGFLDAFCDTVSGRNFDIPRSPNAQEILPDCRMFSVDILKSPVEYQTFEKLFEQGRALSSEFCKALERIGVAHKVFDKMSNEDLLSVSILSKNSNLELVDFDPGGMCCWTWLIDCCIGCEAMATQLILDRKSVFDPGIAEICMELSHLLKAHAHIDFKKGSAMSAIEGEDFDFSAPTSIDCCYDAVLKDVMKLVPHDRRKEAFCTCCLSVSDRYCKEVTDVQVFVFDPGGKFPLLIRSVKFFVESSCAIEWVVIYQVVDDNLIFNSSGTCTLPARRKHISGAEIVSISMNYYHHISAQGCIMGVVVTRVVKIQFIDSDLFMAHLLTLACTGL